MPGPAGSIVIPAHNEATVLGRTLAPLAGLALSGQAQVVVVCNGCSDDSADIARRVEGVIVVETAVPSKVNALNLGDAAVSAWPRIYLDADIEVTESAVREVFAALSSGPGLAARPGFRYDLEGAGALVRAFYRSRGRLPSTSRALWGAGIYALSGAGRSRFERFPQVSGDDLFVDGLFSSEEKTILSGQPVTVRAPRSYAALLAVLRRGYRGNAELSRAAGPSGARGSSSNTAAELLRSVHGPASAGDALVYAATVALARIRSRSRAAGWERDESSRQSAATLS